MTRNTLCRRGITSVLAMMYLLLFTTLALGFYASITTSVQVASNEQQSARAVRAAESGMAFLKYHLANLGIPPKTATDQLFTRVYDTLSNRLNGYPNLAGNTVGINITQDVISIPGPADSWISADADGLQFRATLEKMQNGQQLRVKVFGRYGSAVSNRAVQLDYAIAKDAAKIFNYGVASKSAINMAGNVRIEGVSGNAAMGSVLSATTSTNTPLTMTGNALISGDVSFVNPNAIPSIGSNSTVAGFRPSDPLFASHVHKDVPEVPFPAIDTSAFLPFVPGPTDTGTRVINTSNPSGTYFKNIRIKANSNPTFNANSTIQGIVYIETPNQVTFNGGLQVQGAIVVQTDGNSNESLSTTSNTIKFGGSVDVKGVDTLPNSQDFPKELRSLTGSMLLAPGFGVTFGGNFGTIGGSIVASQMTFNGTAGGTVKGSVINMHDSSVNLSGTSDIIIESQGTGNYPAGVFFGSHYAPLPYTYAEVGAN